MNTINKELNNFNLQINASLLFIISIIISIILTQNEKFDLFNMSKITRNKRNKINIYNRIFTIFIVCIFLYSSITQKEILKDKNKNLEEQNLRILINSITLISALLTLYVAIKYQEDDIDTGQNII